MKLGIERQNTQRRGCKALCCESLCCEALCCEALCRRLPDRMRRSFIRPGFVRPGFVRPDFMRLGAIRPGSKRWGPPSLRGGGLWGLHPIAAGRSEASRWPRIGTRPPPRRRPSPPDVARLRDTGPCLFGPPRGSGVDPDPVACRAPKAHLRGAAGSGGSPTAPPSTPPSTPPFQAPPFQAPPSKPLFRRAKLPCCKGSPQGPPPCPFPPISMPTNPAMSPSSWPSSPFPRSRPIRPMRRT